MQRKEIIELAKKQGDLIAWADRILYELNYLYSVKDTDFEWDLIRNEPFSLIPFSFEQTLILIYSYLLSNRSNDFYRLHKTLDGLINNKRNLKDWEINLEIASIKVAIEKLNEFRENTTIMEIRDKMIAHLDKDEAEAMILEELNKINEFFLSIERDILTEVVEVSKGGGEPPILSFKKHFEKLRELEDIESKYWNMYWDKLNNE